VYLGRLVAVKMAVFVSIDEQVLRQVFSPSKFDTHTLFDPLFR
jgi:hypothetical protein